MDRQLLAGPAAARVPDLGAGGRGRGHRGVGHVHPHLDGALAVGPCAELDGIGQQVAQDLPQAHVVTEHPGRDTPLDRVAHAHALLDGHRLEHLDRLGQAGAQVDRRRLELQPSGFDLREVEDAVQQAQQTLGAIADRRHGLGLLGRQRAVQQDLGHADHAVHGRADLVTHRRQEGRLGRIRRLGILAGLAHQALRAVHLGHVEQAAHGADELARGHEDGGLAQQHVQRRAVGLLPRDGIALDLPRLARGEVRGLVRGHVRGVRELRDVVADHLIRPQVQQLAVGVVDAHQAAVAVLHQRGLRQRGEQRVQLRAAEVERALGLAHVGDVQTHLVEGRGGAALGIGHRELGRQQVALATRAVHHHALEGARQPARTDTLLALDDFLPALRPDQVDHRPPDHGLGCEPVQPGHALVDQREARLGIDAHHVAGEGLEQAQHLALVAQACAVGLGGTDFELAALLRPVQQQVAHGHRTIVHRSRSGVAARQLRQLPHQHEHQRHHEGVGDHRVDQQRQHGAIRGLRGVEVQGFQAEPGHQQAGADQRPRRRKADEQQQVRDHHPGPGGGRVVELRAPPADHVVDDGHQEIRAGQRCQHALALDGRELAQAHADRAGRAEQAHRGVQPAIQRADDPARGLQQPHRQQAQRGQQQRQQRGRLPEQRQRPSDDGGGFGEVPWRRGCRGHAARGHTAANAGRYRSRHCRQGPGRQIPGGAPVCCIKPVRQSPRADRRAAFRRPGARARRPAGCAPAWPVRPSPPARGGHPRR